MSLLFMEGFDWMNGSTTLAEVQTHLVKFWNSTSIATTSANPIVVSRGTLRGLEFDLNHFIRTRKLQQPDGNTTLIFGFYYKTGSSFTSGQRWVNVRCGTSTQCLIECNVDGTLDFYRGATLLATSSYAFSTSTEYYVEFKIVFDNSTGTLEMKVADLTSDDDAETVSQWTVSGVDNINSSLSGETAWDQLTLRGIGANCVIDDIYVCNGAGSSNNDFLGNMYVETLEPTGAGNSTQLTPSTGSNWQNVDDTQAPDGDTTYNTADADAETDLYQMSNPVEMVAPVGVQSHVLVKCTSGNPRDIRIPIRSGTTTDEGDSIQILSQDQYIGKIRIDETDTSAAAWTNSSINGFEMGIKRQA